MRTTLLAPLLLLPLAPLLPSAQHADRSLTEVYSNNDFQLTGVTVSKSGRLFINFPRWSDQYMNAVVEVLKDGSVKPYPDEFWNRWDKKSETTAKQFVCVQSVVADDRDSLWVIDPAVPLLGVVVPGGPKLVRIDLATNQVSHVYSFGPDIAKPDSYLNDVRVDTQRNFVYMTDSGAGGIVVLDLNTGKAHRALDGDPSVKPQQGVDITINGKPVVLPNRKPPQIASDGIALSNDGEYLYYQALTSAALYRVKTSALRDGAFPSPEKIATTFPADGLWMDHQDRLYIGNLNENAVYRLSKNGTLEKIAADPMLEWPDTFSQSPDGAIYTTSSHINDAPQYNQGKSARTQPYTVFKFIP